MNAATFTSSDAGIPARVASASIVGSKPGRPRSFAVVNSAWGFEGCATGTAGGTVGCHELLPKVAVLGVSVRVSASTLAAIERISACRPSSVGPFTAEASAWAGLDFAPLFAEAREPGPSLLAAASTKPSAPGYSRSSPSVPNRTMFAGSAL